MNSQPRFRFSLGNLLLAMVPLAVVFAGLIAPRDSANLGHVTALVIGVPSTLGALARGGSGMFFGFVIGCWIMGLLLVAGIAEVPPELNFRRW